MTRSKNTKKRDTLLVVVAHPDDEVLGCGGTLARMAEEGCDIHVLILADGETSRSTASIVGADNLKARNGAADKACKILGCKSVDTLALPDNRMDRLDMLDVVQHIERFVQRYQPSTVLTHHCGDVNIDHCVVHDAVIAACRPQPGHSVKTLLFFEIPSSTEWRPAASAPAFNPNWFVDISRALEKKLEALQAYESELRPFPHPRSLKAVEVLARWRGATIGTEAAEAFVLGRKLVD
jgi:LmbE family N-acetylglucosaminyl deacetylase